MGKFRQLIYLRERWKHIRLWDQGPFTGSSVDHHFSVVVTRGFNHDDDDDDDDEKQKFAHLIAFSPYPFAIHFYGVFLKGRRN